MIGRPATAPPLGVRLGDAAARGQSVEVIVVVRGRIRAAGAGRWRMRLEGGRVVTIAEEWVVAATPIASRQRTT
jgi:hypothetical protein